MNIDPDVPLGARRPRSQAPAGPQRGSSARMLVIDDEPEIWRAVRAGLAGAGFTVEWASTSAEGLELGVLLVF